MQGAARPHGRSAQLDLGLAGLGARTGTYVDDALAERRGIVQSLEQTSLAVGEGAILPRAHDETVALSVQKAREQLIYIAFPVGDHGEAGSDSSQRFLGDFTNAEPARGFLFLEVALAAMPNKTFAARPDLGVEHAPAPLPWLCPRRLRRV